jgi:YVTN family beta-propeller protein
MLFVTSETAAAITIVDAVAREPRGTIALASSTATPTPPRPMGAVLSPDGSTLYVSNGRATTVSVIDVASLTPTRTIGQVGERPWGIALSADGRRLYTANGPSGDVSVIDVASASVLRRIHVGGSPWGVVAAPR